MLDARNKEDSTISTSWLDEIYINASPEGWEKIITAAHWDDTIPSGWMKKWDKISGWMKNESMPDGLKVSFTAVHKNDTFPSGWMRKCDKISGWMKYESMPDGWTVPFTAAHKVETVHSGWMRIHIK